DGDGDGDGELGEVGDADIEGTEAELLGAQFGVAMQGDGGASTAQLHDFHFAPGYSMQTCAERFADGLFGREPPGETCGFAATLLHFVFGVDTTQEAFAVSLVDFAHAVHFDDIDADRDVDALR